MSEPVVTFTQWPLGARRHVNWWHLLGVALILATDVAVVWIAVWLAP